MLSVVCSVRRAVPLLDRHLLQSFTSEKDGGGDGGELPFRFDAPQCTASRNTLAASSAQATRHARCRFRWVCTTTTPAPPTGHLEPACLETGALDAALYVPLGCTDFAIRFTPHRQPSHDALHRTTSTLAASTRRRGRAGYQPPEEQQKDGRCSR